MWPGDDLPRQCGQHTDQVLAARPGHQQGLRLQHQGVELGGGDADRFVEHRGLHAGPLDAFRSPRTEASIPRAWQVPDASAILAAVPRTSLIRPLVRALGGIEYL